MYYCFYHRDRSAIKVCSCGRLLCEICSEQAEITQGKCQICLEEYLKEVVIGGGGTPNWIRLDHCSDHPSEKIYARCKCGRRLCRMCYEEAIQLGVCTHCSNIRSHPKHKRKVDPSHSQRKKKWSFFSFLRDLITRKGAKSIPYYRGSKWLFAGYSALRFFCILVGIGLFWAYRKFVPEIPVGIVIIFCMISSSMPIMFFGIIDMIYQLRRKNSRLRLIFEVLFYYYLCTFLINRVEPYLEEPIIVEIFENIIILISPFMAVFTEIHMWKAKRKFYNQRRKHSPLRSFFN